MDVGAIMVGLYSIMHGPTDFLLYTRRSSFVAYMSFFDLLDYLVCPIYKGTFVFNISIKVKKYTKRRVSTCLLITCFVGVGWLLF